MTIYILSTRVEDEYYPYPGSIVVKCATCYGDMWVVPSVLQQARAQPGDEPVEYRCSRCHNLKATPLLTAPPMGPERFGGFTAQLPDATMVRFPGTCDDPGCGCVEDTG